MEPIDLFNPDEYGSILREILREFGEIDLKLFNIPSYTIPNDYKTKVVKIEDEKKYGKIIRNNIEDIVEDIESCGFQHNIYTALYEAVLNAYQHGNKKDPNKDIIIAYKIQDKELKLTVSDEGGIIEPEFISYITKFREKDYKATGESYYDFIQKEYNGTNLGVGTNFIHQYVDKVRYYRNQKGGLTIEMIKKLNK